MSILRGFTTKSDRACGRTRRCVVWAEVGQRAYEDPGLNWTYVTFLTLATLIAAGAVVLDSQILVIGARVLGAGAPGRALGWIVLED